MNQKIFTRIITIVFLLAILLTSCNDAHIENNSFDTSPSKTEAPEIESDSIVSIETGPAGTNHNTPDTAEGSPAEIEPPFINPVANEFSISLLDSEGSGFVMWDEVPGVVYYLCKIYTVENDKRADVFEYTLQADWYGVHMSHSYIPKGYGIEVIPLDADRQEISYNKRLISDIYGHPDEREPYKYPSLTPEVHPICDVLWDDLTAFNLLESIDLNSIVKNADGTISFNAKTPDAKTIRFLGKDVEFKDGNLVIHPLGQIWSFDSLGQIFVSDIHTVGDLPMEHSIVYRPMYTFKSDKTSVTGVDELFIGISDSNNEISAAQDYIRITGYVSQGNYFSLGTDVAFGLQPTEVILDHIIVYYKTDTYTTPLKSLDFDRNFVKSYMTGDLYDTSRERFEPDAGIYDFYLKFEVDATGLNTDRVYRTPIQSDKQFTIGELRDKDGNVLNKETDGLIYGSTIDVTIGDYTLPAPLFVLPRVDYAHTNHDLVPSSYPEATGDLNVLVVPLVWQDTPQAQSATNLTAIYHSIGRVIDESGKVTDYSDFASNNTFSLSEYYQAASYSQLNITSFVTDWCHLPYNSAENTFSLPHEIAVEIIDKIYQAYPNMDFSSFDKDANGYFDAVIFINVQTRGTMRMNFYTPAKAGNAEKLGINCYSNISLSDLGANTIIHEFGHNLGLVDYYDVNQSGINAVGQFDMQSSSVGDWNPYSKYSVGWITPKVVTDLKSGESVEIKIGAFADTGDSIVIPGAESFYNGTPFGEYILIDLFTDHGLNESDVVSYGLKSAVGVRIYHVNSVMEGRVLSRDGQELTDPEGVESYPIGTINKTNTYSGNGSYLIELIQAGGDNTFTDLENLRTSLQKEDLFGAGDVFDAAEYTEFFHNGLMDDRKDFGYIIEIVSITEGDNPTATIRIARK